MAAADGPEKFVEHSERLTAIFGYWPSFHDAEVIEFNLWRGDVEPERKHYIFPVLVAKIHLWELTSEVDATGHYILRHHTITTLRFHDVADLTMQGFNQQNAIYGRLSIAADEQAQTPVRLRVEFEPAFGITAMFRCSRIEVVEAEPFSPGRRDA